MAPRISTLLIIPFLAAFQFGCDPYPEYSDLEQWELDLSIRDSIGDLDRPSRVLVGSRISIELTGQRDDDGDYVRIDYELNACVHTFGNGSVAWILDDPEGSSPHGMVAAPGPGSIVISAPHEACPEYLGPGHEFVRDEWSLIGVDPADTTGNWIFDADHHALRHRTGGPTEFPSELGQILGTTQVAEGGTFDLFPLLTQIVDGEVVEVRNGRSDGGLVVPEPYQSELDGLSMIGDGEQVETSLVYEGAEIPLPTLEGVAVDRITSLELVAVYHRDDSGKRDWGLPSGVIALARDDEGRRIYGAPVEWSVTRGLLSTEKAIFTSDVLGVADSCRSLPVSRDRRDATIEARVGELVATVDFEWTALRDDDVDIDTESPLCQGSACDCSASATPTDSLAALFGLFVLGIGLRRGRIARPHVGQ